MSFLVTAIKQKKRRQMPAAVAGKWFFDIIIKYLKSCVVKTLYLLFKK